jgi:hypothetical protein
MIAFLRFSICSIAQFLLIFCSAFGQKQTGIVINENDKKPIEYVNIGVIGKGIGTNSDINGKFDLNIDNQYNNDSLRFSSIGYKSYTIKVSDFKQLQNKSITLKEKLCELKEVIISPKLFKLKTLGYTTKTKAFQLALSDTIGYEGGVYLKIKKSAKLNKINLNIIYCTYDTIFYRINIYKVIGKMDFQNILVKPIYVNLPKDKIKDNVSIDISKENIIVNGDCLVTIEHVKKLSKGAIYFSAALFGKSYYRLTSQANWKTYPVGISISVDANVEK